MTHKPASWLSKVRKVLSRERLSALEYFLAGVIMVWLYGVGLWNLGAEWRSFGYALVLVTPLTLGVLSGYFGNQSEVLRLLSVLCVGAGLVVSVVCWHLAGLYCAFILWVIALIPMVVGMGAGQYLRRRMAERPPAAQMLLPLVLVVLPVPGLWWEGQAGPPAGVVEVVRTSRVVALSPEQAWDRIVFYEEVPRRPPALARIGLPRPLHTEGEADGVGAVKRCVYTSGHLLKRITVHEPPRWLTFEVLEQHQVEDRSVDLIDGGFLIEALSDGRSRVTLETRYRPLLQARLFWRPFEVATARVLHEHVLDGIALGVGDTGRRGTG